MNYTLEEYARDVVYHIQNICDEAEVPHPTIITESGRAMAAYHSVLVFNVLGVSGFGEEDLPASSPEDSEQALVDLFETHRSITKKNLLETYHDAQQALDSALNLFSLGYLSLEQRSLAENFYWAICRKILQLAKELDYFPEELEGLDAMLSDTYFCNFSLFQSMPDSWAVKQLFPDHADSPAGRKAHALRRSWAISPAIPTARSINLSIAAMSRRRSPCILSTTGSYILGAFLLGAYQEILGDMHNLFGDTNAVHVSSMIRAM